MYHLRICSGPHNFCLGLAPVKLVQNSLLNFYDLAKFNVSFRQVQKVQSLHKNHEDHCGPLINTWYNDFRTGEKNPNLLVVIPYPKFSSCSFNSEYYVSLNITIDCLTHNCMYHLGILQRSSLFLFRANTYNKNVAKFKVCFRQVQAINQSHEDGCGT